MKKLRASDTRVCERRFGYQNEYQGTLNKTQGHVGFSKLQAEFKFVSVVSRHFWRSRAFLTKKKIFNPMLGQLIALMKWLASSM